MQRLASAPLQAYQQVPGLTAAYSDWLLLDQCGQRDSESMT